MTTKTPESPPRIEDYAVIGDCETAALVSRRGSLDWLCWPRFDSDACFAALLGTEDNGQWSIEPATEILRVSRRYRGNTLILETTFDTPLGTVALVDFMPPRGKASDVVRLVIGVRGSVPMRMRLTIRFGYGRLVPWVSRLDDGTLRAIAGPDMLALRTAVEMRGEGLTTLSDFTVAPGQTIPFTLTYGASHEAVPAALDPLDALESTHSFWSEWASRYEPATPSYPSAIPEHWNSAIHRSLLALKAMTYAPTGGIVAATTTSLPEWMGGSRNWDYRCCWLRDSALTLMALMNSGYLAEAQAWRDWLVRAIAGSVEQIQIMYGLAGERRLDEWELDWLPGFAGSRPVRVGNGAHKQLQLDVYGEVMILLHQARVAGIPEGPEAWSVQKGMLAQLEQIWREPDEGIWEVRGDRQQFTFSKMMAWAAFDFCIQTAVQFELADAPVERWRSVRDTIHADVCEKGYDEELGSFVSAYGSKELDASLLLIPTLGFLPTSDARVLGTIAAVERELLRDGFVRRYRNVSEVDGIADDEGAFLACSFWLVGAYVSARRLSDAIALFERLLAIRNDVGLLAEEYDPKANRQLGNFPQGFSHVALINAGQQLIAALAQSEAERASATPPSEK